MKNIYIALAALALTACEDWTEKNFDIEDADVVTDVKSKEYTLTEADYTTISKYTAVSEDQATELKALATTRCFSATLPASAYVPTFMANLYPTADNASAVQVTYNNAVALPSYLTQIAGATIYKLTAANYTAVWEDSNIPYFTPSTPASSNVPAILDTLYAGAVSGDMVWVDYNESENEPSGSVVAVKEDFEAVTAGNVAAVEGWNNITTVGTYSWAAKSYSDNLYLQQSAYKHTGELESYMISPKFTVVENMKLTFDACYGNYVETGGRLSVLVSSDLSELTVDGVKAATWTDLTSAVSIPVPEGKYGTLGNVCSYELKDFVGKDIYVAFRYNGNGTDATTTVQMDNVVIKSAGLGGEEYAATASLFEYNGTAWSLYKNATVMNKAAFTTMGSKYDNFSSSMLADNYLPIYLTQIKPYAQEGNTVVLAYKYYASSETTVVADEYTYTSGAWVKTNKVEAVTNQFVKTSGSWKYDPSCVIELPADKNNATVLAYYQGITDWVWEHIDQAQLGVTTKGQGYVTSYGNNEYYTGCSAYYGNVDWRVAKARDQYKDGYPVSMSDEDALALMKQHFIEGMGAQLAIQNPTAKVIDGIDVTYTVNFIAYDGSNMNYTVVYKVVGDAQFEYVEGSLKEVE